MVGRIAIGKRLIVEYGLLLDQYRGPVPLAVLVDWIARETGGDRFAVSRDPVLIEVGLSQAPLARARALDCDPFDDEGGCWLAGYEAVADARRWRRELDTLGQARWLARDDHNLWYVCQMDYSIGTSALRHLITCATLSAEHAGRIPSDLGLMGEIINYATANDLSLPQHARHWGRQTPEVIVARCIKHRTWIEQAATFGPVDGCPPGWAPPERRPAHAPSFPRELIAQVLVCLDKSATADDRKGARKTVEAYAKARKRREGASSAPIFHRIARFIWPHFYRRRVGDLYGVR